MVTLDHIEKITADPVEANNELITLDCLATGLGALANQVAILETPYRTRNITFFGFGLEGLPPHAEQLLPCYFHWFGISICNYARLIGFLSGIHSGLYTRDATESSANFEIIKNHCSSYVAKIPELKPILEWRNKVFAHFAITDPRKSDNPTLLDVSTMSPITMLNSRFSVGGFTINTRGSEIEMPTWSVTDTYEKVTNRFWPNAPKI